ncbi:ribose-5-phosphate isomerase [Blastocystis sp. ATCC 50177/Nand II]|uniref:ribose-5-phosphate isomerase n=1 Tax=Blastocystis sp. subtype 1 (strain ATCC 50177 / NandII) TaxID=478820 RepID=A0A196S5F7_BLAHN|nr:ribose-5-phosphate isomerase [Blastocystis sp. ATCC 50177/Nand II]OAO16761.1 ribose-5-phosphate isomerase [Blastocystis sp. ATCC 50177/Nand II]
MSMNELKKQSAVEAVKQIKSGDVVGLGTGSTAYFAVEEVGRLLKEGLLHDIVGVATSIETDTHARALNIPMVSIDEVESIDIAIDGADEVDPDLQLIKGKGAALLREKSTEILTSRFVVIVDESKIVKKLGTKDALPVEIVPFGWKQTQKRLEKYGVPVLRPSKEDPSKPLVTDNGNFIIDLRFPNGIDHPAEMDRAIKQITGVVDHGLFINMATTVIVAAKDGIKVMTKN